jgi:hypothetical protein
MLTISTQASMYAKTFMIDYAELWDQFRYSSASVPRSKTSRFTSSPYSRSDKAKTFTVLNRSFTADASYRGLHSSPYVKNEDATPVFMALPTNSA